HSVDVVGGVRIRLYCNGAIRVRVEIEECALVDGEIAVGRVGQDVKAACSERLGIGRLRAHRHDGPYGQGRRGTAGIQYGGSAEIEVEVDRRRLAFLDHQRMRGVELHRVGHGGGERIGRTRVPIVNGYLLALAVDVRIDLSGGVVQ